MLQDPACRGYSQALLYYKGYHALQTQRIAHALWNRGQQVMARLLHSRISEVLSIDIHPAAVLGRGILLDHGTGVVIGETAVIGDNVSIGQVGGWARPRDRKAQTTICTRSATYATLGGRRCALLSLVPAKRGARGAGGGGAAAFPAPARSAAILHARLRTGAGTEIGSGAFAQPRQNVTLGGTGKEDGDRHPKISDDVLIGANVTVLGNIPVGQGAQVSAAPSAGVIAHTAGVCVHFAWMATF
jgi:serine acetyltransferase